MRLLFARFVADPESMPAQFAARTRDADEPAVARQVADYIAGMTDRYALAERQRLER